MKSLKMALVASVGCVLLAGPGVAQACDQQEAQAKATKLSQLVQAKMASDPAAGQAMMAKMQPIMQSYQGKMTSGQTINWDSVCDQYDEMLKQAQ